MCFEKGLKGVVRKPNGEETGSLPSKLAQMSRQRFVFLDDVARMSAVLILHNFFSSPACLSPLP